MMAGDFYSAAEQGHYDLVKLGDLPLECGETLRECELAVATFGSLNAEKDNAILVPTWYAGTHKAIADAYIGPGRALDPERYFIIVANQIGGGLSTSPNTFASGPGMFPDIAIEDDVTAQERLVTSHFGIDQLALVVGGSMGGMQAFAWSAKFPEKVQRVAALAASPCASSYLRALLSAMDDTLAVSLRSTSAILSVHARLWAVLGLSPEFFSGRHFENLGFGDAGSFVAGFLDPFFAPMNPEVLRCMIAKAARADVEFPHLENGTNGEAAKMPVIFALPIKSDAVFPPSDVARRCWSLPNAKVQVLDSAHGHLALFGADPTFLQQVDEALLELLEREV